MLEAAQLEHFQPLFDQVVSQRRNAEQQLR
jgi:hypothetical protein